MATLDRVQVRGALVTIRVLSLDHCPPHATAFSWGNWVARIEFSFINNNVTLMDIVRVRYVPGRQVINDLENAILGNLKVYRDAWWGYQQHSALNYPLGPCCLHNQMLGGKRINTATYDPTVPETRIVFDDGSAGVIPL